MRLNLSYLDSTRTVPQEKLLRLTSRVANFTIFYTHPVTRTTGTGIWRRASSILMRTVVAGRQKTPRYIFRIFHFYIYPTSCFRSMIAECRVCLPHWSAILIRAAAAWPYQYTGISRQIPMPRLRPPGIANEGCNGIVKIAIFCATTRVR